MTMLHGLILFLADDPIRFSCLLNIQVVVSFLIQHHVTFHNCWNPIITGREVIYLFTKTKGMILRRVHGWEQKSTAKTRLDVASKMIGYTVCCSMDVYAVGVKLLDL